MTLLLSDQIEESIGALDANQEPSREQLLELAHAQRHLLAKLKDFAGNIEQAHRERPHVVPMWATSAAAAKLYHDLAEGELPPGTPLHRGVVVSVERFRGRRA